jgi:capsular exopolysaccharide synthesis family protein
MDNLNQPSLRNVALVSRPTAPTVPQTAYYSTNPYGVENDTDDSNGGLIEYWRILRRNFRSIFIAALAGLIIGFAVGIPMKPVYRATTALEVLTINEDFLNMKQASPTSTNDNNFDTSEEETQAKLLKSGALVDRVFSKLDPNSATNPLGKSRRQMGGWRTWFHLPQPVEMTQRQQLLSRVAKTLKVSPTAHTRVLEVSADSTDPQLSMDFVNTLTQEFIAQNMEARWNSTQRTSEWLRRELDDARDRLRHSEDALQTYARSSGLIFTDDTTNVATEKLQQVQQSLSAATADRIAKQSRFELAQNSPPQSLADILNDASLRETQSKINDLTRQIADLSAVYDPQYTKVRRLQAELDSLQAAFDRSRTDILSRIKTDYQEATRKEKLLTAAYTAQAHEVTGQDEKAIQYNILKRDVDSNRQLYDTMLQQMKQASIATAMRASNVRIVDPAKLPDVAVSPNFKLNSALGLLGGLVLSICAVVVRERADRTLQQPGDIKLWLELPELGTIPSALVEGRKALYGRYAAPSLEEETLTIGHPGLSAVKKNRQAATSGSVELVTFQKKPTLIAEAFRSALTSVLFVGEIHNRPRVLVFTSANPAEGKTTVASNMAIAAAEIRCKVLVIDADLRRPRMHKVFDVPNDLGLTDLLQGDLSEDTVASFIHKTKIPYLHILPAGPSTHAAAHLLHSPNFAVMITRLRKEYDMIFIDTPPMLQMTDARVAGRTADAVVLVARAGQTTRDAILAAKERLEEDRTKILGTVLNDWDPKRAPGGYYGYYRSSHYNQYQKAEVEQTSKLG